MTFDVPSDGTRVAVAIDPRADGRSTVTITHEGLADAKAVEAQHATWKERLARLAGLWPSGATGRWSAARAGGSPPSTDD